MKVKSGNTVYMVYKTILGITITKVMVGGTKAFPTRYRPKMFQSWIDFCKDPWSGQDIYFTFSRRKALSRKKQLERELA